MKIMECSEPDDAEERIAALEKKCREMEALVSTLLDELLDLKSISMKLSRDGRQYQSQTLKQEPDEQDTASSELADPAPSGNSTIIRPKTSSPQDVPAAPPEPAMVRIMQSDGTFKMEVRRGDTSPRDSSGGWDQNKKSTSLKNKKNP